MGRTHRKNARCGPAGATGRSWSLIGKMFTQIGAKFPQNMGLQLPPVVSNGFDMCAQETMTEIQPGIFNRYEAKFFSRRSWRLIFGEKLAPIGCTFFSQNMSLQLLAGVP